MGPSGSGKTTLLSALAGRISSEGVVTLNGDSEFDRRTSLGFVEQDDALLGVLTVRETLTFSSRLNAPELDACAHRQLVDQTLEQLGLSHIADQRIGTPIQRGISGAYSTFASPDCAGGQKRRVTLGCGLVQRPRILLADEPTSGLDASTSLEVISALKRTARETGCIVIGICVMKQRR